MSLKQLLIASYRKELYKQTSLLQQMKIKNAVAKNQVIFLQRCIYHNITPKSFRLKTPIKSKKAFNIMNVYKKKLIVIAKNNAKDRMHNAALKVNERCQILKAKLSEEHYLLIQSVTEKSRENEFVKKKEHLICKFDELQTTSSKKNNQQITTTYVKPSIINITDIALTDHQISLLDLGPKFVPTEKRIFYGNYYSNGISSIKLEIPK